MIQSFGDKSTEDIFHGDNSKEARKIPHDVWKIAFRKLDQINAAKNLDDLKQPPGNRLEALRGGLKGFHSIRINGQYRVIFVWTGHEASKVRIVDYH